MVSGQESRSLAWRAGELLTPFSEKKNDIKTWKRHINYILFLSWFLLCRIKKKNIINPYKDNNYTCINLLICYVFRDAVALLYSPLPLSSLHRRVNLPNSEHSSPPDSTQPIRSQRSNSRDPHQPITPQQTEPQEPITSQRLRRLSHDSSPPIREQLLSRPIAGQCLGSRLSRDNSTLPSSDQLLSRPIAAQHLLSRDFSRPISTVRSTASSRSSSVTNQKGPLKGDHALQTPRSANDRWVAFPGFVSSLLCVYVNMCV